MTIGAQVMLVLVALGFGVELLIALSRIPEGRQAQARQDALHRRALQRTDSSS